MKKELEVKYGLPKEIKYCTKCNMSNQQPMSQMNTVMGINQKETIEFDNDGLLRM